MKRLRSRIKRWWFWESLYSKTRNSIKKLDDVRPGWEWEIDLDRLTMLSLRDCVLGQLYGDWATGLGELGLTLPEKHDNWPYNFASRDDEWRRAITMLREMRPQLEVAA